MPGRCCPLIDGTFVQLSSSDQSSVPNRQAQMQVSSSDHCERTIHVTWQRVRSMNSVSFAMLRAEKAGVFQTPQTLCWEEGFVSDAAVLRRPEILSLLGIMLPVPVPSQKEQSIEMHWTNFAMLKGQTFALVQCLAGVANWWDIRAAIQFTLNHQYRTESTDAGVSKWPYC